MVKSGLTAKLIEKFPDLKCSDVELAVGCILGQMVDALLQGEHIEIRGFGSFGLRYRTPRIARNPKTGESVALPAKIATHFKPGQELKDRVNASRGQSAPLSR